MSEVIAQSNLESLQQAKNPRKMGKGGGSLPLEMKGKGVRAGKMKHGSEKIMHEVIDGFTKEQRKRIHAYRTLVDGVIQGKSVDEFGVQLAKTYLKYDDDLVAGGFLSPAGVRDALKKAGLNYSEAEQAWKDVMENRENIEEQTQKNTWEEVVKKIIFET